nr:uncharacterized protein LOC128686557 [Cherax quadricarinatus]
MLFNILINTLLNALPASPKHIAIIYADDIMIHTTGHKKMNTILNEVQAICNRRGLIISSSKTKILTSKRHPPPIYLQGEIISYVKTYRYLGVDVPFNKSTIPQLNKKCKDRLNALKAVAGYNPNYGANVRIVRMMHIAYVGSLIDYAAPMLILARESSLRPLELMQNEALRIILGCPKSTKVLNMRKELGISSISDRIVEINTVLGIRMLRNEPDTVTMNLTKCLEVNTHRSKWIVKTCKCIKFYNLHEVYHCRQQEHFTPPWNMCSFNITYLQVPPKKLIASNPFLKSLVKATA